MRRGSLCCGVAESTELHQKPSKFARPAAEFPSLRAYQRGVPEEFRPSQRTLAQGEVGNGAGLNPAVLTAQVGRPDFPGVSAVDLWASGVGSLNLVLERIHARLFTQPRPAQEGRWW